MRNAMCLLGLAGLLAVATAVRSDDQAETKALVDKAIKAMGGADKLAKFATYTSKGKGKIIDPAEIDYTDENWSRLPEFARFDMELDVGGNKIKEVFVFNGPKGWLKINDSTTEMPKEMLAAFRDYFHALRLANDPLALRDKDAKLSPLGEMKINDRPAIGLQVSCKGKRDVNVYFDKENGLPLKCETTAPPFQGGQEVAQEFFFEDYKEFEGVKVATKMTWKQDGKKYMVREVSEIKPEEKIDDSTFDKP
jgi:hypothetical protein